VKAAWDVSLLPISLRLSYLPPIAVGPLRPAIGIGGAIIFSTVVKSSNYYVLGSDLPLFPGRSSTETGWGGNVHLSLLLDVTNEISLEFMTEFATSSKINQIEILDTKAGATSAEMSFDTYSLVLELVYLPF
jgi:hypothetical protein